MPWVGPAIIAASALISGGLSYAGSQQQAGAAKQAGQAQLQAAQETNALNKYIYDTTRSDYAPYRGVGTNALTRLSDLNALPRLGVESAAQAAPGSPSAAPTDAAALAQIRERLAAWDQALPGNAKPVMDMIDNGASLGTVQSALQSLRATTSNPRNTAYLDPALQIANSAVSGFYSAPGQQAGGNAIGTYDNSPSAISGRQNEAFAGFRTDPGYQFAFSEGQKAIERSAAARGRLQSGATMKALTRFGQGIADQQYGEYYNRLSALAGIGQSATGASAAAGQNFASNYGNALQTGAQGYGNALQSAGSARASGYGGIASSVNQGVQNYNNSHAYQQWLNSPYARSFGGYPYPGNSTGVPNSNVG